MGNFEEMKIIWKNKISTNLKNIFNYTAIAATNTHTVEVKHNFVSSLHKFNTFHAWHNFVSSALLVVKLITPKTFVTYIASTIAKL